MGPAHRRCSGAAALGNERRQSCTARRPGVSALFPYGTGSAFASTPRAGASLVLATAATVIRVVVLRTAGRFAGPLHRAQMIWAVPSTLGRSFAARGARRATRGTCRATCGGHGQPCRPPPESLRRRCCNSSARSRSSRRGLWTAPRAPFTPAGFAVARDEEDER